MRSGVTVLSVPVSELRPGDVLRGSGHTVLRIGPEVGGRTFVHLRARNGRRLLRAFDSRFSRTVDRRVGSPASNPELVR